MKIKKQIERLKELDKLNLFEFEIEYTSVFSDEEGCIMIKCLNYNYGFNSKTYEESKLFIKQFYRNLNETLNNINEILNDYDLKYDCKTPYVYIYMKNVIEKHLLKEKLENNLTTKTTEKRSKI